MQYSIVSIQQRKMNHTPSSELHVLILQKKSKNEGAVTRGTRGSGPNSKAYQNTHLHHSSLLIRMHPWSQLLICLCCHHVHHYFQLCFRQYVHCIPSSFSHKSTLPIPINRDHDLCDNLNYAPCSPQLSICLSCHHVHHYSFASLFSPNESASLTCLIIWIIFPVLHNSWFASVAIMFVTISNSVFANMYPHSQLCFP